MNEKKGKDKKNYWPIFTAFATLALAGVAIFPIYREWKVKHNTARIIRYQLYLEVCKLNECNFWGDLGPWFVPPPDSEDMCSSTEVDKIYIKLEYLLPETFPLSKKEIKYLNEILIIRQIGIIESPEIKPNVGIFSMLESPESRMEYLLEELEKILYKKLLPKEHRTMRMKPRILRKMGWQSK